MENVNYGISNVTINGNICKTVKFGDGLTRIYTSFWGDQYGLKLIRSDEINNVCGAFSSNKIGDNNWIDPDKLKEEAVYIVFDNTKSIDAMITQLKYLKNNFQKYKSL